MSGCFVVGLAAHVTTANRYTQRRINCEQNILEAIREKSGPIGNGTAHAAYVDVVKVVGREGPGHGRIVDLETHVRGDPACDIDVNESCSMWVHANATKEIESGFNVKETYHCG